MSEVDYVVYDLGISQETTFNFADLYKLMQSWFSQHGYMFLEKEYIDTMRETGKCSTIKWEGERIIDDYVKFHISITITCFDIQEVELKDCIACEGKLNIAFKAYVERDYEGEWEKNFALKFVRAAFDKFVLSSKLEDYSDELKKDTYGLFNKIKSFLRLKTYKS